MKYVTSKHNWRDFHWNILQDFCAPKNCPVQNAWPNEVFKILWYGIYWRKEILLLARNFSWYGPSFMLQGFSTFLLRSNWAESGEFMTHGVMTTIWNLRYSSSSDTMSKVDVVDHGVQHKTVTWISSTLKTKTCCCALNQILSLSTSAFFPLIFPVMMSFSKLSILICTKQSFFVVCTGSDSRWIYECLHAALKNFLIRNVVSPW